MAIFYDAYIDLGKEMSQQKKITFPFKSIVGLKNQIPAERLVLMPTGIIGIQLLIFTQVCTTIFKSLYHCTFSSLWVEIPQPLSLMNPFIIILQKSDLKYLQRFLLMYFILYCECCFFYIIKYKLLRIITFFTFIFNDCILSIFI